MAVLRDAGGLGDVVRIFAVLDALAVFCRPVFFTDRCYTGLCTMCPSIAAGRCEVRFWDPKPCRSPIPVIRRWRQAWMPYADPRCLPPETRVIDLFCPALAHELKSGGAPTIDRLDCWFDAAGVQRPARGCVRLEVPPGCAAAAERWAMDQRRPLIAVSPSSNASIRTYRNGAGDCGRTGLIGGLLQRMRSLGMNPVVFDTATRGAPVESISDDVCLQAARLARCDAFVGPDSGMLHVAAALRVPVVALFGPTDPELVMKPYDGRICILRGHRTPDIQRRIGCLRPCYGMLPLYRPNTCAASCPVLESITESSITDAVGILVKRPRRSASTPGV